ncbi:hypothetical protein KUV80_00430 [Fictibacillus nanhaiensis]|uniref:hypothetical protein n=1 Tax=Fictibacillus nanhaiensis TaxID=742169 RepID=UPI001C95C3DA|nr:hypothetical protein [Fictibacillus nanhaiensis]MBY6035097.1 hypothetical protein [Fictibacillus nanhaiensis]
MKAFVALCFTVMLSFLLVPNLSEKIQETSATTDNMVNQPVTAEERQNTKQKIPQFNENIAKEKAKLFMDALKQEIDANYKVIKYSTKEELISHLKNYVSEDIAVYYTDGLFEERESSLYIIPTELPPWLEEEQPVDVKQLSDTSYRVYQKNTSDLYGTYEITLGYEYIEEEWIITFASVD